MLGALAKLLPAMTLIGGAAASSPNINAQISKIKNTTKVIATQQEVSDIAKMIYLDSIDGQQPRPESFAEYLRSHMRPANGTKRDFSTDLWEKPYRLVYNKQRRELAVSSSGPDSSFDTADDIVSTYPLER